jgi:hypothetical protein
MRQEEWIKTGFDNSGIQGMIDYEEFKSKGYFVVPADPEWKKQALDNLELEPYLAHRLRFSIQAITY